MIKKILSVICAAVMLFGGLVACGEKPVTSNDSSTVASVEETSSEKKEESSSSKKESSSNKTESVSSKEEEKTSSKKNTVRPGDEEEEEEISSETQSTSIKVYKNNDTLQLNCYHFSMGNCKFYGTDRESKLKEFTQVVESGCFNSYFLGLNQNLLTEVEVIAKNGGTFWIGAPKTYEEYGFPAFIEECEFYFDLLEKAGYLDLLNGFHWDEPSPSESYLKVTEGLYKKFGLRNYPVFAVFSFSNAIGNDGEENIVDGYYKLNPYTAKYLTDIGYDAYSVDVREGASNGNKYKEWQEKLAPGIVDGKSYYTEIKKVLQKCTGHQANFWYYPTAYRTGLWGGLTGNRADEDYCIAMFEFLRDDLLKEEFAGGLSIYTYGDYHGEHATFRCSIDIKDEKGNHFCDCGNVWPRFTQLLKDTRKQFDSIKRNKPNLGL